MRNNLNKAINFVAGKWRDIDTSKDLHTLALVCYTLHRTFNPQKDEAFNLLDSLAKTNKTAGDNGRRLKWWERRPQDPESGQNPWNAVPNAINVQMTSYALLTILLRISDGSGSGGSSKIEDALPVVEWLLLQQNANGGDGDLDGVVRSENNSATPEQ